MPGDADPQQRPDLWYGWYAEGRLAELAPDTDPEAFGLAYAIVHFNALFTADLEETVHRPLGLSLPGFRLMFKLWLLGPTRPTRLAELSAMSGPSVTSVVNTLERGGLVRRRKSSDDGRAVEVELTTRGKRTLALARQAHEQREAAWFAPLTSVERGQLADLLRRLSSDPPRRGGPASQDR
jgi:DNA-binding MarR family transcriptional regulator